MEVYGKRDLLRGDLPDIPRFQLPRESFKRVLWFFDTPQIDRSPNLRVPEIGVMRIRKKNGEVMMVCFYDPAAKSTLQFSLHGVRFMCAVKQDSVGDHASSLYYLLEEIYSKACVTKDDY